jgi:hypothetical protein
MSRFCPLRPESGPTDRSVKLGLIAKLDLDNMRRMLRQIVAHSGGALRLPQGPASDERGNRHAHLMQLAGSVESENA